MMTSEVATYAQVQEEGRLRSASNPQQFDSHSELEDSNASGLDESSIQKSSSSQRYRKLYMATEEKVTRERKIVFAQAGIHWSQGPYLIDSRNRIKPRRPASAPRSRPFTPGSAPRFVEPHVTPGPSDYATTYTSIKNRDRAIVPSEPRFREVWTSPGCATSYGLNKSTFKGAQEATPYEDGPVMKQTLGYLPTPTQKQINVNYSISKRQQTASVVIGGEPQQSVDDEKTAPITEADLIEAPEFMNTTQPSAKEGAFEQSQVGSLAGALSFTQGNLAQSVRSDGDETKEFRALAAKGSKPAIPNPGERNKAYPGDKRRPKSANPYLRRTGADVTVHAAVNPRARFMQQWRAEMAQFPRKMGADPSAFDPTRGRGTFGSGPRFQKIERRPGPASYTSDKLKVMKKEPRPTIADARRFPKPTITPSNHDYYPVDGRDNPGKSTFDKPSLNLYLRAPHDPCPSHIQCECEPVR